MPQLDLFKPKITLPRLVPVRSAPRLWVKRLALWKTPSEEPIRDIAFRRGLNIVLAPDGEGYTANRDEDMGHGAGKSLLCRLLRYALGEKHPGTKTVRDSISGVWPDGLLGAEIELDGQSWSVVRSLGAQGRHVAAQGIDLTLLSSGQGEPNSFYDFIDTVERSLIPPVIHSLFPENTGRNVPWLFALAWMSRDQECRLSHPLDWRSGDAQSNSPVRGRDISVADLTIVMRLLLGSMDEVEREHDSKIDRMESQLQSEKGIEDRLRSRLEDDIQRAVILLNLKPGSLPPNELTAVALEKALADRPTTPHLRLLTQTPEERELKTIGEKLKECHRQEGALKSERMRIPGDIKSCEKDKTLAEATKPDLFREEFLNDQPTCPLCVVPISRVLLEQRCDLSEKACNIQSLRQRAEAADRRIAELDREIGDLRRRDDELTEQLSSIEEDITTLEKRGEEIQRIVDEQRAAAATPDRARWAVQEYREHLVEANQCAKRIQQLTFDLETLKRERSLLRSSHQATFTALNFRFQQLMQWFMGPGASASVDFEDRRVQLKVHERGNRTSAAFDSLKIVALDLSALMLNCEGYGHLPGFLIHDSPREADLGQSLYNRLFQLAAALERPFGDSAPFQYIVTTTSDPPRELNGPPWVVQKLGGLLPEERLLRRDL